MSNIKFSTKEELHAQEVEDFRESAKISPFQARTVLRQLGIYDDVIAIIEDPQTDDLIKDAWEYATEFNRNSVVIKDLARILGLSDDQVDNMFKIAIDIHA